MRWSSTRSTQRIPNSLIGSSAWMKLPVGALFSVVSEPTAGRMWSQIMLVAAFVSLATAAYLYSQVAAEEGAGPRTALEVFCAGLVFSVALQLLFLGIVELMRDSRYAKAARFTALVSKWFVGPTIFASLSTTAVDAVELNASGLEAYESGIASQ